ncbi:MAG: helix-turn-helix domain-containing protein [Deltaproteobacteria bacterium]|jgi:Mn-dependent DtxR family transcriptional regulator|nr:helix-turn-helix domain-containing protein [Deltaproteobacteria bacterium]MBW2532152.1 helix-turn-helix domain-containing protein [Deltaproteobacteria bacterium]
MLEQTQLAALQVLYQLARGDRSASSRMVADLLGISRLEAVRLLDELDSLGLVDSQRVRLTLSGLTVAVACPVQVRARRRGEAADCRAA